LIAFSLGRQSSKVGAPCATGRCNGDDERARLQLPQQERLLVSSSNCSAEPRPRPPGGLWLVLFSVAILMLGWPWWRSGCREPYLGFLFFLGPAGKGVGAAGDEGWNGKSKTERESKGTKDGGGRAREGLASSRWPRRIGRLYSKGFYFSEGASRNGRARQHRGPGLHCRCKRGERREGRERAW
jgi:hypothetical protein